MQNSFCAERGEKDTKPVVKKKKKRETYLMQLNL